MALDIAILPNKSCGIRVHAGYSPGSNFYKDAPMFDPSQLTLGQVSSTIRDFSIVAGLITAAWKARGWFESGAHQFKRWNDHMDAVEKGQTELLSGMQTLLTNHLTHIEADLAELRRKSTE